MPARIIRNTILLLALSSLSGLVAAAGSQAGDNGRQPIGADNDSPRQAIPNATSNDGTLYDYDYREGYYVAPSSYYGSGYGYYVTPPAYYVSPPATIYRSAPPTYYVPAQPYYVSPYGAPIYDRSTYYDPDLERALWYCETRPLTQRPACRNAAYAGRF
jgi:hypothetical protein